jgi:HK97 family phage portal protein
VIAFGLELLRVNRGIVIRRAPLSPVPASRGGWLPLVREPFTGAWQRNQEWTTQSVLAHHAVYACITRIAQDVGKLRPKLVEQDADGIWSETRNAAHSPVLQQPNRYQNHIQFKEWWITSKLLHGNAYALKARDGGGVVRALYLLDPCKVRPLVADDGAVFYELTRDALNGQGTDTVTVPASEIVHDRMNCLFHPLVGVSPIFACGVAANMGLTIQQNSSSFFARGSSPAGILSSPDVITKAKSEELAELWELNYGGGNSGRVAVLGNDMKFSPMRMNNVDSQLLEQLKWTAETVCSTFHVPPFKVAVGAQPTYANAEIANQVYYSDCLQSHIEAWELCMDEALGLRTGTNTGRMLGVELDLDGLLRMDTATQIKTLAEGVGGAVFTPNEARRKADLRPLAGGDTVYMQQQNFSLAALDARDKAGPPPGAAPTAPPSAENPPADPQADRALDIARRIRLRSRFVRMAA